MQYSGVQFISYETNTVALVEPVEASEISKSEDVSLDIEGRCALMHRAMKTARDALAAAPAAPGPERVLKVFMAPEYFFCGADRPYRTDDVQRAIAMLQALAAGGEWGDWVFSFGTIVGTSTSTLNGAPGELYNFALIQEGGAAGAGPAGARVVARPINRKDPAACGATFDGTGIFSMRGLTWLADICQDAASSLPVRARQMPGEPQIQIQLFPSAGASIPPDGIFAAPDGFVFHVDGAGRGTALRQVGAPEPIAPRARVAIARETLSLSAASAVGMEPLDRLCPAGAGEIVIFDPHPLPPVTRVLGSRQTLSWQVCEAYRFAFDLIYDEEGRFSTILVAPSRSPTDMFHGNHYFLPLEFAAHDPHDQRVEIAMSVISGTADHEFAVWCKIALPGFQFDGPAIRFALDLDGPRPWTVW